MASAADCPCSSGRPYRACCQPFHRGEREAPDAEALMRSRFSAFVKKEAAYLLRTLHADHPDRARPEAEELRAIRTASSYRYLRLTILDRSAPDAEGIARVLFLARVFEKGQDRSFVEASAFAHDGEGWRYLRGKGTAAASLGASAATLTLATLPPALA